MYLKILILFIFLYIIYLESKINLDLFFYIQLKKIDLHYIKLFNF